MNERIKKFAEQAGAGRRAGVGGLVFRDSELEKFAELIVKECAQEAFLFWCNQQDSNDESAEAHILKRFGIKK